MREVKKDVHIFKGRSYEHDYNKDYMGKFPYDIERLPSDSNDFYKGYCEGMEELFKLVKRGDFAEEGLIYDEFEEDCDECEECFDNIFNEGYDIGFKKGIQIAHEEIEEDIYISGYKIGKIDDIKHKVIALNSDNSDKVNEILADLTNLIKDEAMQAVEDYLGYR